MRPDIIEGNRKPWGKHTYCPVNQNTVHYPLFQDDSDDDVSDNDSVNPNVPILIGF